MFLKNFIFAFIFTIFLVHVNAAEIDCEHVELGILSEADLNKIVALAAPANVIVSQDESSIIKTVRSIPEIKDFKVDVEFCLSNADFKDDFTNKYGSSVDNLKKKYPQSIKEYPSEVCIDTALIAESDNDLDILQTKFNSKNRKWIVFLKYNF